MSILRLNNPFSGKIKYLKDNGKPQTLVRTGGKKSLTVQAGERTLQILKTYWDYYSGDGTIFAALNITAWNTVMVGYTLRSDNPEAKLLIERFCDNINLLKHTRQAVLYTLIFGDSFTEKIGNKGGEISRLKVADSRTMLANSDEYGDILDYQQEINGQKMPAIDKEDIMHFRFFEIPGTPYGLSIIAPNKDTIDRKISTDEALFNAIQRHGTLKWVAKVGNEKDGQVPPETVMDDIRKQLEDIESKNEFVMPWFIDLKTIDEQGIEGVEEYFNYFQTQLVIGLLCPEEALGLGKGSTEATARVKAIMYERMIKAFQLEISNVIKQELFNPLLEKNGFEPNTVTLKFNDVTEEDQALRFKWLGNLLRGLPEDKFPMTVNELREMLGLQAIHQEEPKQQETQQPKPQETEQPEEQEDEYEEEEDEEEYDQDNV